MMKRTFISLLLLILAACVSDRETTYLSEPEYYVEASLSFFDPYEPIYAEGRYQGYIYETWLRQPDNLRMVHETLKKIGYDKLISERKLYQSPLISWGYINRPLNNIIDSLIITYPLDTIPTQYYREFWQRRKGENNQEVVYDILLELQQILLKKISVPVQESAVNDTLYQLVRMKHIEDNPTPEQVQSDFNYLVSIGLHGSAYKLLYEYFPYEYVPISNKSEWVSQLQKSSEHCCPRTWIRDNTK